jgi:hypothetical protein
VNAAPEVLLEVSQGNGADDVIRRVIGAVRALNLNNPTFGTQGSQIKKLQKIAALF